MFNVKVVSPSSANPDTEFAKLQTQYQNLSNSFVAQAKELAQVKNSFATAQDLAELKEQYKQWMLTQERHSAAIQNLEARINGLLKAAQDEPNEPSESSDPNQAGWTRFDYQNPSFRLNLSKTSGDRIIAADDEFGLRFATSQLASAGWSDLVKILGWDENNNFILNTASNKSLYISLRIDSLSRSNHLVGLIDASFDLAKADKVYQQCAVAVDFSEHGLRQQHRIFGKFGMHTAGGSAMPTNGAQVTLRFKPNTLVGFAEVSLHQVNDANWNVTNDSFRIFSVSLPQAELAAKLVPCWAVYGEGVLRITGIKIA